MTLSDYAASHGCTKGASTRWSDAGYLHKVGRLVDVDASDAELQKRCLGRWSTRAGNEYRRHLADPAARAVEVDGTPTDDQLDAILMLETGEELLTLEEARRRREVYSALLTKLQYERDSAQYARREDAESLIDATFDKARARLRRIPVDAAHRVLACTTPMEVQEAIAHTVHEALRELSHQS